MIKNIDDQTRIVTKWYFIGLGHCVLLQRKKRRGWKTTAWNYTSVMKKYSIEWTIDWLFWEESNKNSRKVVETKLSEYKTPTP